MRPLTARWFRRSSSLLALALPAFFACAAEKEVVETPVLGGGGIGPVSYSTNDTFTPGFWEADSRGISNYVGAGGDSQQPPLQPRPTLHADRIVLAGDQVASLAIYWPARSAELRVADLDTPNDATSAFDLTQFAASGELDGDGAVFFRRFDRASLFAIGERLAVVIPSDESTTVAVFELSNGELALGGRLELPFGIEHVNLSVSERPEPPMGWPRVTTAGTLLVFQARRAGSLTFEIVDLGAGEPRHVASANRGEADRVGPLRAIDGLVLSERRLKRAAGEYSYVLDRLDLRDPNAPAHLRSVSVPGPVVGVSPDGARMISVGVQRAVVAGVTTCCPGGGGCGSSDMTDECEVTREKLVLVEVLEDDAVRTVNELSPDLPLGLDAVAPHALGAFGVVGPVPGWPQPQTAAVVTLNDLASDDLGITRYSLDVPPGGYGTPLRHNQTHLAFASDYGASVTVLAADPLGVFGEPRVETMPVLDLALSADRLFVATGTSGIVALSLE